MVAPTALPLIFDQIRSVRIFNPVNINLFRRAFDYPRVDFPILQSLQSFFISFLNFRPHRLFQSFFAPKARVNGVDA